MKTCSNCEFYLNGLCSLHHGIGVEPDCSCPEFKLTEQQEQRAYTEGSIIKGGRNERPKTKKPTMAPPAQR